jgi:hypothetical protein
MKFSSAIKLKLIYVFRINDTKHIGCLKIGEATSDIDWIQPITEIDDSCMPKKLPQNQNI